MDVLPPARESSRMDQLLYKPGRAPWCGICVAVALILDDATRLSSNYIHVVYMCIHVYIITCVYICIYMCFIVTDTKFSASTVVAPLGTVVSNVAIDSTSNLYQTMHISTSLPTCVRYGGVRDERIEQPLRAQLS